MQWQMLRPDNAVVNANVCILHDPHVVLHVLQIAGLQRIDVFPVINMIIQCCVSHMCYYEYCGPMLDLIYAVTATA